MQTLKTCNKTAQGAWEDGWASAEAGIMPWKYTVPPQHKRRALQRMRGQRETQKAEGVYWECYCTECCYRNAKRRWIRKNPSFIATMKSQKYPSPAKFPAHFDYRFAALGVSLHPQTGGTFPHSRHAQALTPVEIIQRKSCACHSLPQPKLKQKKKCRC